MSRKISERNFFLSFASRIEWMSCIKCFTCILWCFNIYGLTHLRWLLIEVPDHPHNAQIGYNLNIWGISSTYLLIQLFKAISFNRRKVWLKIRCIFFEKISVWAQLICILNMTICTHCTNWKKRETSFIFHQKVCNLSKNTSIVLCRQENCSPHLSYHGITVCHAPNKPTS